MGKEAINESWLLGSWTAKHGGSQSELVAAVNTIQFLYGSTGFAISAKKKIFNKGITDVWVYMD